MPCVPRLWVRCQPEGGIDISEYSIRPKIYYNHIITHDRLELVAVISRDIILGGHYNWWPL